MTFTELGAAVQLLINQTPSVANYYTSANLSSVINFANLDVCREFLPIESDGAVDTVAGTDEYALSASYMTNNNYLAIRNVFWNGRKLQQVGNDDASWQYGETKPTGDPWRYRIYNNKIELDFNPTQAKTLKVKYYARPATLVNATANPEIAPQYHMAIVYLACSYLTLKDGENIKENSFYQRYQIEAGHLRRLGAGFDTYDIPLDPSIIINRRHTYNG